jgi:hypothetical protein
MKFSGDADFSSATITGFIDVPGQINLILTKIFCRIPKILTKLKIFAIIAALEYLKCHLFPNPAQVVPPHLL